MKRVELTNPLAHYAPEATGLTLRILGEPSAELNGRKLGPESPHVFAALVVLALSPQQRAHRRQLATLLWPDASSTRRAERLRWLLSKLRSLGAPITTSTVDVGIHEGALVLDTSDALELLRHGDQDKRTQALIHIDAVLGTYAPDFSAPLTRWVEDQRETIGAALLAVLVPMLTRARSTGDWLATERFARAVRRVAPLHEEATLALAESMCAGGDKANALALLEQYEAACGDSEVTLRLPVELLRRRIRSSHASPMFAPGETRFVGRTDAMRRFHAALGEARAGRGRALLVAGQAGIGKTRLLDEMATQAIALGTSVVRARWHARDAEHPLSGLTNLVRSLLDLRGAAGCDPVVVEQLHRLCAIEQAKPVPVELPVSPAALSGLTEWLRPALTDLLGAVSEEQSVMVALDDFQWADASMLGLWETIVQFATTHRILWCFAARAEAPDSASRLLPDVVRPGVAVEWLSGLEPRAAGELVEDMTSRAPRPASDEVREALLARGGGIPLVLQTVVRQWQDTGDLRSVPTSLGALIEARLGQLGAGARRCLQVAGLLGAYSRLDRLERVLGLARSDFLDALAELERAGVLTSNAIGETQGHVLWADAAVAHIELSVARVLHGHIAADLEREMQQAPSVPLLWETARHWGLCGQHQRQLAAIVGGAEHLVRNRLFGEAARCYALALEVAQDDATRLKLLHRQAYLLRFAGAHTELLQVIDRHEALASRLNPLYDRHNALEMFRYTIHIETDPTNPQLREAALRCASDPAATHSHRIHATYNCLRLAAFSQDRQILQRVRGAREALVPATLDDARYHFLGDITCHELERDYKSALAAAREWHALERHETDPYWKSWCVRFRGFWEVLAGDVAEGQQLLKEAIHVAREAGLALMVLGGYSQYLMWSVDYAPPEETMAQLRAAEPWAVDPTLGYFKTAIAPLVAAQCHIEAGRGEDALRVLQPDPPAIDRLRPWWCAIRLAARMLGAGEQSVTVLGAELKAALTPTVALQEFNVAVYAEFLEREHGADAADEFVREYFRAEPIYNPPPPRMMPFYVRAIGAPPVSKA